MARPVDLEKRAEIGQRAVEALQELGLEASMTQLADAIGVKRPTLLYHYPTRAAILENALAQMLTEQAGFVIERMEREAHPIDQLFAQIRAVHEYHAGREARVLFLTQALAGSGAANTDRLIAMGNMAMESRRQIMAERCRAAIREGTMAECDVDALIRLVRSLIDGLMVQRVMTRCDLAPLHAFIWERFLAPLKLAPR
ncbi:MAG: TetR/AcrR family transcriptional regulator [Sandaracinaceae bacterium]